MKLWARCSFFTLFVFCVTDFAFGFNPEDLNQILGIKYAGCGSDGEFAYVQKHLGRSKFISTGDASSGKGAIYYITQDKSQVISFWNTECQDGFDLVKTVHFSEKGVHPAKLKINVIEIQNIHLGMTRKEVENILKTEKIGAGFTGSVKYDHNYEYFTYTRKLKKDGESYDDEDDVTCTFDKSGKLIEFEFSEGECF
jgi:hypothetical protein